MNNFSRLNRDFHKPVLTREVIEGLRVKRGSLYIDATIGGGGHTQEIVERGGRVLGFDQDETAVLHIKKEFEAEIRSGALTVARANFSDIGKVSQSYGFNRVDGVLFDLGVSSYQIEKSGRGFSFLRDEKLDMRMAETMKLTAADIVNKASEKELSDIFLRFGEERHAGKIAAKIAEARRKKPIQTTRELSDLITSVVPRTKNTHPATKVFQALRITVNSELDVLKKGLTDSFELLNENGRLAVISFHSLEDRIVKLFGLELAKKGKAIIITKKPIVAAYEEIVSNRRARSAKLRIVERK